MTKPITPEMIAAWRTLQAWALAVKRENYPAEVDVQAAEAIDVLDNADYMVPLERAEEAASGEGPDVADWNSPEDAVYDQPDPAEWGDTTRDDMARHQREAAVLAAGGEVRVATIPLNELTGEGLLKAIRRGKGKR